MSAAKTKAQKIIDENGVVVFSKSYCPYCRATKSLLSDKHAKFYTLELDQVGKYKIIDHEWGGRTMLTLCTSEDGADLQDALEEITGQRSVPNIFISQKHIGGNSDIQAKKGQLDGLLKSAGAV